MRCLTRATGRTIAVTELTGSARGHARSREVSGLPNPFKGSSAMSRPIRKAIAILIVLAAAHEASAQTESKARLAGSISGRVILSGKPAPGVKVVALHGGRHQAKPVSATRTDADGHYELRDVPPGDWQIAVDAPSFAAGSAEADSLTGSKAIKLEEGESVDGIDLEISPGAVITGRITETNGRPVIGETVYIAPLEEGSDKEKPIYSFDDRFWFKTDDRGVYRAYGLPAGRYRVKVGSGSGRAKPKFGRVDLPVTYYSVATDRAKTEVVEVAAGSETTDINIKVNRSPAPRTKDYSVTGRIVDGQTGKALPGVSFSYQNTTDYNDRDPEEDDSLERISEHAETDSKGQFRIGGLPPGKYKIEVFTQEKSPWYAKAFKFEISSSNVQGLEVRVRQAGSISGVVVLENTSDPAVVAKISQLKIGVGLSSYSGALVNKDGSFHLTGLGPRIHPLSFSWDGNSEGFAILRVERDGAELDKAEQALRGIKVGPGENVTGVRVIVAHYAGVVRGQINIEGALPPGGYLEVSATPVNQPKKDTSWAGSKRLGVLLSRFRRGTVDARGRFVIERLPPGEYEINLDAYLTPWKDDGNTDEDTPVTVTRVVTVSDVGEARVDFVLDLSKTPLRKQP